MKTLSDKEVCRECGSDDNFWINNFGRIRRTELCGKCGDKLNI